MRIVPAAQSRFSVEPHSLCFLDVTLVAPDLTGPWVIHRGEELCLAQIESIRILQHGDSAVDGQQGPGFM